MGTEYSPLDPQAVFSMYAGDRKDYTIDWTNVLNKDDYIVKSQWVGANLEIVTSDYTKFTSTVFISGVKTGAKLGIRITTKTGRIYTRFVRVLLSSASEFNLDLISSGPVPGVVTGLEGTPAHNAVVLTWDAIAGATEYLISSGDSPDNLISQTTTKSVTTAIAADGPKWYAVQAANESGEGAISAAISVAPLNRPTFSGLTSTEPPSTGKIFGLTPQITNPDNYTITRTRLHIGASILTSSPLTDWANFGESADILIILGLFNYTVWVEVETDEGGIFFLNNSRILTLVANTGPSFSVLPPSSAFVGIPYNFTVTAQDPNNDPVTITALQLPSWMSFIDNNLAGTPIEPGAFTIILSASDGINPATEITVNGTVSIPSVGPSTQVTTLPEYFRIQGSVDRSNPAWIGNEFEIEVDGQSTFVRDHKIEHYFKPASDSPYRFRTRHIYEGVPDSFYYSDSEESESVWGDWSETFVRNTGDAIIYVAPDGQAGADGSVGDPMNPAEAVIAFQANRLAGLTTVLDGQELDFRATTLDGSGKGSTLPLITLQQGLSANQNLRAGVLFKNFNISSFADFSGNWVDVSAQKNPASGKVWQKVWPYKFGFRGELSGTQNQPNGIRFAKDVLIVNNEPIRAFKADGTLPHEVTNHTEANCIALENSFFIDEENTEVLLHLPDAVNPNTANVEVATAPVLVKINGEDNVLFENLHLRGSIDSTDSEASLFVSNSNNIAVLGGSVRFSNYFGMKMVGDSGFSPTNFRQGFYLSNIVAENNYVNDLGSYRIKRSHIIDALIQDNGWRALWAGHDDWDATRKNNELHEQFLLRVIVQRIKGSPWWPDLDHEDVYVFDSLFYLCFEFMYLENNQGPMKFRRTRFVDMGGDPADATAEPNDFRFSSHHTTFRGCLFYTTYADRVLFSLLGPSSRNWRQAADPESRYWLKTTVEEINGNTVKILGDKTELFNSILQDVKFSLRSSNLPQGQDDTLHFAQSIPATFDGTHTIITSDSQLTAYAAGAQFFSTLDNIFAKNMGFLQNVVLGYDKFVADGNGFLTWADTVDANYNIYMGMGANAFASLTARDQTFNTWKNAGKDQASFEAPVFAFDPLFAQWESIVRAHFSPDPIPAPVILSISPRDTGARLVVTPQILTNVSGYEVLVGTATNPTTVHSIMPVGVPFYDVLGLTNEVNYFIAIRPISTGGEEVTQSNELQVTPKVTAKLVGSSVEKIPSINGTSSNLAPITVSNQTGMLVGVVSIPNGANTRISSVSSSLDGTITKVGPTTAVMNSHLILETFLTLDPTIGDHSFTIISNSQTEAIIVALLLKDLSEDLIEDIISGEAGVGIEINTNNLHQELGITTDTDNVLAVMLHAEKVLSGESSTLVSDTDEEQILVVSERSTTGLLSLIVSKAVLPTGTITLGATSDKGAKRAQINLAFKSGNRISRLSPPELVAFVNVDNDFELNIQTHDPLAQSYIFEIGSSSGNYVVTNEEGFSALPIIITPSVSEQDFYVRSAKRDFNGTIGEFSEEIHLTSGDTAPPSSVTNVSASPQSFTTSLVTWTPPAEGDFAGVVIRTVNPVDETVYAQQTVLAGTTQATLDVPPNSNYEARLYTYDTDGNSQIFPTTVSVPPTTSTVPTATVDLTPSEPNEEGDLNLTNLVLNDFPGVIQVAWFIGDELPEGKASDDFSNYTGEFLGVTTSGQSLIKITPEAVGTLKIKALLTIDDSREKTFNFAEDIEITQPAQPPAPGSIQAGDFVIDAYDRDATGSAFFNDQGDGDHDFDASGQYFDSEALDFSGYGSHYASLSSSDFMDALSGATERIIPAGSFGFVTVFRLNTFSNYKSIWDNYDSGDGFRILADQDGAVFLSTQGTFPSVVAPDGFLGDPTNWTELGVIVDATLKKITLYNALNGQVFESAENHWTTHDFDLATLQKVIGKKPAYSYGFSGHWARTAMRPGVETIAELKQFMEDCRANAGQIAIPVKPEMSLKLTLSSGNLLVEDLLQGYHNAVPGGSDNSDHTYSHFGKSQLFQNLGFSIHRQTSSNRFDDGNVEFDYLKVYNDVETFFESDFSGLAAGLKMADVGFPGNWGGNVNTFEIHGTAPRLRIAATSGSTAESTLIAPSDPDTLDIKVRVRHVVWGSQDPDIGVIVRNDQSAKDGYLFHFRYQDGTSWALSYCLAGNITPLMTLVNQGIVDGESHEFEIEVIESGLNETTINVHRI